MNDAIDADYRPLAVREDRSAPPQLLDALRPAERVALMAEMSAVIKDVIDKQGWFVPMKGGRNHVKIEGWTFVGGLGGCSAKTVSTERIEGGWKAHAVVVRVDTGIEVGSADQVCMTTEPNWRGKPDQALIGMASTRACSRALSTVFRHVVELAGYSATPAEEMPRDAQPFEAKRSETPRPERAAVARVPLDDLLDLARPHGIADAKAFGKWCVAQGIAPDLLSRERKVLTPEETQAAKAALEALIPPAPPKRPVAALMVDDDLDAKMKPRTRGRLFALFEERLSVEKESQLVFAAEHGVVVTSRSDITELQGRALIRQLEMIPPPPDPDEEADAALAEYAEGRLL